MKQLKNIQAEALNLMLGYGDRNSGEGGLWNHTAICQSYLNFIATQIGKIRW